MIDSIDRPFVVDSFRELSDKSVVADKDLVLKLSRVFHAFGRLKCPRTLQFFQSLEYVVAHCYLHKPTLILFRSS